MKKALLGLVVVLALGGIVFASLRGGSGAKGTKVYVDPAVRQDIGRIVKASGEIDPRVKVNISAHVIGKIDRLYVKEGDRIERGQPFLKLEQQAFLAARDQWAAQLRKAETEAHQARVSLADSNLKLERAKKLKQEGIVSTESLEAAQLAVDQARLQLENAGESITETRANLVKAQDDLTKTTIYAPLSGRVIQLNAEEGEVVVSGTMNNAASVIGVIADLSEILAKVDVDETEVVLVRPGQSAKIRVDALPNKEYHGRVVEVGSSGFSKPAQPDVTFFNVKVLLDNPDEDLRPGMSVRAEIDTAVHPNAVVVPIQAVVERSPEDKKDTPAAKDGAGDQKVVFVVENGKAVQRPVSIGISDETRVEVVTGLKPGDKVVTGPYRSLRDLENGEAVAVTDAEKDREKARKEKQKEKDKKEDGDGKVEVD
jgi:HlyD family secretion protein